MAHITSVSLMLAAMAAAQAAAFPVEAELRNNCWRNAVETETSTEVAGESTAKVVIKSADQLQRVLSNIEQLISVAMWPEGVGLSLHFGADEGQQADPAEEAARKAAEDAQANADAAAEAARKAANDAAVNAQKEAAEAAAAAAASAAAAATAAVAESNAAAQAATGKAGKGNGKSWSKER